MNPTGNIFYHGRGLIFRNLKNLEQAMADFNYSIHLDPDYDTVYMARGILYYEKNDREKAEADFKKAVELNRDNLLFINELEKRLLDFNIKF